MSNIASISRSFEKKSSEISLSKLVESLIAKLWP